MSHQARQIGFEQTTALKNLDEVVREWIVPFLDAWVNSGPQPRASAEDTKRVIRFIKTLSASHRAPEGYAWLPGLLKRLAGGVRFNARNFVNIHPTPLIPAIVAALVASIQNPNNIVEDVSKATTELELESVQWMSKELVGFDPAKSWGNVVKRRHDREHDGLDGCSRLRVSEALATPPLGCANERTVRVAGRGCPRHRQLSLLDQEGHVVSGHGR
jgi:hypothetical protein